MQRVLSLSVPSLNRYSSGRNDNGKQKEKKVFVTIPPLSMLFRPVTSCLLRQGEYPTYTLSVFRPLLLLPVSCRRTVRPE